MSAFCEVHRLIQRLPISRSAIYNYAQRTISSLIKESSNGWSSSYRSSIKHNNNGYQLITIDHPRRYKYSKSSKKKNQEDSDDDEDDDVDDTLDAASKVINASVPSLRIDAIIKASLGLARNKVEVLFYEHKLRLNGKTVSKKSHQVVRGDEIDVINGFSQLNPNLLEVSRVVLLSAKADTDSSDFKVKLRRYKSLPVENYEEHPWKDNREQ